MFTEGARHSRATLVGDRKSTRLNSSHLGSSYAVFCLKNKMRATEIIASTVLMKLSACSRGPVRDARGLSKVDMDIQITLGRMLRSFIVRRVSRAMKGY